MTAIPTPPRIPLTREPDPPAFPLEQCCFCSDQTQHWTALGDRDDGEQVACCILCAHTHEPDEVPSKEDWCHPDHVFEPAEQAHSANR